MCPPKYRPDAHPIWWVEAGTYEVPKVVRFIWLPASGELRVGVQIRHALQRPVGHAYPLAAWLRGFSFAIDKCLVLRTYHWPEHRYDWFNAAHARLDLKVSRSFLRVLRPHMPARTLVFDRADYQFLRQRFAHLS